MNSLTQQKKRPSFSVVLQQDAIKNLINNTLGDEKRATRFITAISSRVAITPELQVCDPFTIINGALQGESLNLSASGTLGHYYLVPFKDKDRGSLATFILGYKGYIQLAMRSGEYRKLNVVAIKEGELVKYDPLNEEVEVNLIEDDEKRENATTIGYYAMFEYLNGFRKTMYWSKKKMKAHALKYSQGYRSDVSKGTNWTFWSKDFDGMAFKTMLRQLISKWGIMSEEMQRAYESDNAVINEKGNFNYVDNDNDYKEVPQDKPEEVVEITEETKEKDREILTKLNKEKVAKHKEEILAKQETEKEVEQVSVFEGEFFK